MLKKFLLLVVIGLACNLSSFGVTFTNNFQLPGCPSEAPTFREDQTAFLSYSIVATESSPSTLTFFRKIYYDFYDASGNLVATTEENPGGFPLFTTGTINRTFDISADLPSNLASGYYEVRLRVRYHNGSQNFSTSVKVATQLNGTTVCHPEYFSQNGSNHDIYCDVGVLTCFNFVDCHEVSINYSITDCIRRRNICPTVTGGSGSYSYFWNIDGKPLPIEGPNVTTTNRCAPLLCGNRTYFLQVIDNETGCVVNVAETIGCIACRVKQEPKLEAIGGRKGQESREIDAFEIFPNPASDLLTLSYPKVEGNLTWTLYNLQGQKVLEQSNLDGALGKYKINVSQLPDGLYMTRITDQEGKVIHQDKVQVAK